MSRNATRSTYGHEVLVMLHAAGAAAPQLRCVPAPTPDPATPPDPDPCWPRCTSEGSHHAPHPLRSPSTLLLQTKVLTRACGRELRDLRRAAAVCRRWRGACRGAARALGVEVGDAAAVHALRRRLLPHISSSNDVAGSSSDEAETVVEQARGGSPKGGADVQLSLLLPRLATLRVRARMADLGAAGVRRLLRALGAVEAAYAAARRDGAAGLALV